MLRHLDAPQPLAILREHCERLLRSPQLDASGRSRTFLRFVVDETLEGRGNQLTQRVIATAVFGRGTDFDAVLDPIVRVQAGRLRRALERYYLLAGAGDPVSIELPKGSYTPVFHVGEARPIVAAPGEDPDSSGFWRAVMIASCLGHLGQVREAREKVAELLVAKPGFGAGGATLIGSCVQSAGLRATIFEGLAKGGLILE